MVHVILTYLCVIAFGASSWLSVNTIFVELPLLVDNLPEGWSLPSYLAVLVQITNIGPLFYTILKKCTKINIRVAPVIIGILIFDIVCHIFLAIFWKDTVYFAGESRSLGLFLVFSGMAFVDCLSDVIFIPYMASLRPIFITAFFIGVSFSALIPSAVSLIQGSGSIDCVQNTSSLSNGSYYPVAVDPLFSFQLFNGLMIISLCISLTAFLLLHFLPAITRNNRVQNDDCNEEESKFVPGSHYLSIIEHVTVLISTVIVCGLMNGILPQVQSYAALPYGQMTYHLAITLGNLAHPVGSFLPVFVSIKPNFLLLVVTGIAGLFCSYVIVLAAMSPYPILLDSGWGSAIRVLSSIFAMGFLSYLRAAMASILRSSSGDSENRLFWYGVFSQAGSAIGACIMFPLVSIYKVFHDAPYC